ncbi:MAG: STAS domain-containing protein [Deltaproteobacteria bacterium]|nr:STAS domain-containing protein [Deltaproteobacteria bacterium]
MTDGSGELQYVISEKAQFVVISFSGTMFKASVASLDECQTEVLKHPGNLFVLNLRDVTRIDNHAIPQFIKLQKALRDKPGILRVCNIQDEVGKFAFEKGAIRESELAEDLMHALSQLQSESQKR